MAPGDRSSFRALCCSLWKALVMEAAPTSPSPERHWGQPCICKPLKKAPHGGAPRSPLPGCSSSDLLLLYF